MLEEKVKYVKIHPTEKWNYRASIALKNLLSSYDFLLLHRMDNKLFMDIVKNDIIALFQVGYVSYPGLNNNFQCVQ